MVYPKISIFKQETTESYLKAALETEDFLSRHAHVTEQGTWWDLAGEQPKQVDKVDEAFLNSRSLYSGAAGIGFFYLQLWEATGEEDWLETAKDAAEYLIQTYTKDYAASHPGFHGGASGEVWFADRLYEATDDRKYLTYAKQVAEDVWEAAVKEADGTAHWQGTSDYMGDAGALVTWLDLAEVTRDSIYVERAGKVLDYVVSLKKEEEDGTVYWKLFDVHDFFPPVPAGGIIPNFAHGTAGVVFMLTRYYEAVKDPKYLDLAERGFRYLQKIAVRDGDAAIVPYVYFGEEKPPYHVFYLGFCHGPVGDAITARELYRVTGNSSYVDSVRHLTAALLKAGVPERRSAGYWNDCICCGSSGVLLHFLDGMKLSQDDTEKEHYRKLAEETADKLIHDSYQDEEGRRWYNAWTRVEPWNVQSHLGLFDGAAGSASALLSLYGAEKGIPVTQLLDFA